MDYLSGRILDCDRLRKLGHMYQSRGAYATAFTFFVDALKRLNDDECDDHYDDGYYLRYEVREYDRVQTMRDIAQLARLGKEDSAIIAVYDLIRKVYRESDEEESVDLDLAFLELAKVHQLGNEGKKAWEIDWEDEKIQGWNRRARVLLDEAHELRDREDPNFAISVYTEALTISVNICDGKGRADALWGLAEVCRLQNGYEEAIPLYSEALKISTDRGHRKGIADALHGLADVHRLGGEYEEAITLYYKALGIFTEINDKRGKAAALLGLAAMRHDQGGEGDNLCQLVAEIIEPPRKLTDPASDDERLLRLRTRVLDWLVGRLRSFASDLENGTPRGTASDPGVSLQEVHIGSVDKSPSKIDAR
ncbi:hypothetical protein FS837_011838 [Tulasnella sp. UAMH 9824]|nr:hypothetical protein FS837_011838 [Tulasnella sp. UAMH 9824]